MTDESSTNLDLYTNNIQIAVSVYDVMISFGLDTYQRDGTQVTKEVAIVRMSPQHALALSTLLNKNLEVYGETFKDIFLPEQIMKQLKGETVSEETGGE